MSATAAALLNAYNLGTLVNTMCPYVKPYTMLSAHLRYRQKYYDYLFEYHRQAFDDYMDSATPRQKETLFKQGHRLEEGKARCKFPTIPNSAWCWPPPRDIIESVIAEVEKLRRCKAENASLQKPATLP